MIFPARVSIDYFIMSKQDLPGDAQMLVEKAQSLLTNPVTPYAPYSRFLVGAAVRCLSDDADPVILTGVNVESVSYGLTLCAERAAFTNGISAGYRCFDALACVVKKSDGPVIEPSTSCGACRQWIAEMSDLSERDMDLYFSNSDASKIIYIKASALIPLSFTPRMLGIDLAPHRR